MYSQKLSKTADFILHEWPNQKIINNEYIFSTRLDAPSKVPLKKKFNSYPLSFSYALSLYAPLALSALHRAPFLFLYPYPSRDEISYFLLCTTVLGASLPVLFCWA
jgi:hypothetical protein